MVSGFFVLGLAMVERDVMDGGLGGAAITASWWVHSLADWLQMAALILGLILLLYRIAATRLEVQQRRAALAASAGPAVEGAEE